MRWPFTTWPIWRPRRLEAAAIRVGMITAEAATDYVRAADLAAAKTPREQGEPMADDLALEVAELKKLMRELAYSELVLARSVRRMSQKDTAGPELADETERLRLFYQRQGIAQRWLQDPLYQPPGRDWIGDIVD